MKSLFIYGAILLIALSQVSAHSKEEWKTRAIYQIITDRFATSDSSAPNCNLSNYCGGTFKGIINKLDYIKGMGFDAIWISPVVENTEGSYHGYHMTNLYKINEHFGSAQDLKDLVKAAHDKDIWVMVDVVANHVGPVGYDFEKVIPFNSSEYYHEPCLITDWNNQWMVENCRLSNLPDLKQESEYVTSEFIKWIRWLVQEYNFDGIRIDSVPEVPKWFWDKFTAAAGVFQIGECFNGNPDYVGDYQNHMDALVNYPMYYIIQNAFCGSMKKIEEYIGYARTKFRDPSVMGTFVENHDNPRFLNMCGDRKKFKNASIFSILYEGIPIYYYGGEQWYAGGADPQNREILWPNYNQQSEMYQALAVANKVRKEKQIWNSQVIQRYADDVFYAFTRGDVLVCLTRGEGCQRTITYHEFSDGTRLCNAFDSSDCVTVQGHNIYINMGQDPKIYVKQ